MSAPNDNGTNNPQTVTGGQFGVIIDGSPLNQIGVPAGTEVKGPIVFDSPTVTISGDVIANSFTGNFIGNITNINVANSVAGANVIGPVAFATVANSVSGPNVSGAVAFATTANSVAGANVVGEVAFAAVANSVDGSNVVGIVANAAYANVAGTVANAVQSNITTIGTLTQLDISGRVNGYLTPLSSNFYDLGTPGNAWRTLYTSNVSAPANGNLSLLGNRVSLGTAANVKLAGGLPGQFLQTTGNGNLLWSAGSSGNGTVGGTNTQIQFNDSGNFGGVAGFTFDSVSGNVDVPGNVSAVGNVSASYFIGNGSQLTDVSAPNANYANFAGTAFSVDAANVVGNVAVANLALSVFGANVSGAVANADYANIAGIAYSVDAGNIVGNVAFANVAEFVSNATQSNITAVGTLTSLSVSGNVDVGNLSTVGDITAGYFIGDGSLLSNLDIGNATVANANYANFAGTAFSVDAANVVGNVAFANVAEFVANATQSNITSVGNLTSLTVTGISTLGNVGNVNITGGSNAQVLTTDGTGNLNWTTPSGGGGASISNGTSNVNIATANGDITVGVNGTSNVMVISNTIANINDIRIRANAIVLGNAAVSNVTTVSIGSNANAGTANSIAIGLNSIARLVNSVTIGVGAQILTGGGGESGIAIGTGATAAQDSVAMGRTASTSTTGGAVSIGLISSATGTYAVALGRDARTAGAFSVAVGGSSRASADQTVAIGTDASAGQVNSVALGMASSTTQANSTALGHSSSVVGANGTAIGRSSRANANAVAVGYLANSNAVNSIVLNATSSTLTAAGANTFVVKPVRQLTAANVMYYSPTSGEISYDTTANITAVGTLSTLSVSGNANVGNIGTAGLITATGNISGGNLSGTLITGTLATANQPNITNVGTLSSLSVSGTANIANLALLKFNETVITGNVTGTITPDVATGSIFNYTLTGNITMDSLSNVVAGTSSTLILKQDATGNRTLTSTMKFAGGVNTLSTTANAIDVMGVFYDGSTYYASLTKGYV